MTKDDLLKAARVLRQEAICLRESHTIKGKGHWAPDAVSRRAKREFVEWIRLADLLDEEAARR